MGKTVSAYPSPEEIENAIRNAKDPSSIVVRKDRKYLRVDVDGRTYTIEYDENLYRRFKEIANEVKGTASRGRTTATGVSDVALFQTTVRGRRPLVEQLMDKLTWLQGALLDVGAEATLAILLASGEKPERIPEIIQGFGDKSKLVNYVVSKLYNFVQASRECADAMSLKERMDDEVKLRDLKIVVLEQKLEELSSSVWSIMEKSSRFRRMLEIAVTLMTPEQLDKYIRILKVMGLYEEGSVPVPSEGGVES